jgi:hypothetical protein
MIQMGLGYRTMLVMGQAAFEPRTTKTIIAGDLRIDDPESKTLGSAQLVVNGASDVTVSGDLRVGEFGRLIQTNQLDRLSVDGKARFEGYMPAGSLTAGVLAVKRDLEIRAGSVFVADATHRLVLDGTALQTILVEGAGIPQEGGQALGSVQLTNRAQPGVLFISAGHLQGDLTLDPDTHLALEKDRRVYVAGNLFDDMGTTIDIPNTATSELSVLNIMLQRHTALQKPVTNRLGAP